MTPLLALVPPVVVLSTVVGALWVAVSAVLFPVPFRVFPRVLLSGVIGSLAGQWVAEDLRLQDYLIGDTHLAAITVGAVLVSSLVRRLVAW